MSDVTGPSAAPKARRHQISEFPDQPRSGQLKPPTTIPNIEFLLREGGYECSYDVIRKRHAFRTADGKDASMNAILSYAVLNDMQVGLVFPFVYEIAECNPINPVQAWIRSKPWDQVDRLPEFYATVYAEEGYPAELKQALLYRWMLGATAAALKENGFKAAGVLTFQGGQGIGKTSWGKALVPPGLREQVLKDDLHLDPGNKDSVISAISSWIGEIGEVDSSFRKDIARLKGFLTSDSDRIRVPYGKVVRDYPRRTVFFATVNEAQFLVDNTGNRRWWTIPVDKLDYEHSIDMQQVFAQLAVRFDEGDQWWLTPDEERLLSEHNKRHQAVSVIAEMVRDRFDLGRTDGAGGQYKTARQILLDCELKQPTNAQCKECGSTLREALGPPKRIHGRDCWRVYRRKGEAFTHIPALDPTEDDGEIY